MLSTTPIWHRGSSSAWLLFKLSRAARNSAKHLGVLLRDGGALSAALLTLVLIRVALCRSVALGDAEELSGARGWYPGGALSPW